MSMFFTQSVTDRGFTLVEVLVAVSILLFVIVGPMTIAVQSSRSTEFATEQAIAFFLAQEGLELAQNARDNYQLDTLGDATWDDFRSDYSACFAGNGCWLEIDPSINVNTTVPTDAKVNVAACSGISCVLFLDATTGVRSRYTHNESAGDTETPYTRRITMELVNPNEVKVTSRVQWRTGAFTTQSTVEATTYLFNIYETP